MLWWTLWKLRSTNLETRRKAVKHLGTYHHAKVLKHFVALLSDGQPEFRRLAAEGVSRIAWSIKKHVQWVPPGMALPKWDDQEGLGAVAVQPLITALQDDDPTVREQAAEALGAVGDPHALDALISLLHDSSRDVRRQTADTLAVLGDSRAAEPLVGALSDQDQVVRLKAAEALERLGWEPQDDQQRALRAVALSHWEEAIALGRIAVGPLVFALHHSGWLVRYPVIEGLGTIGDAGAVDALVEALGDHDPGARRRAVKALARIGKGAVNALLVTLESHDWELRRQSVGTLGVVGDIRAVQPLVAALGDQDIGVRWQALDAIERIGGEAVEPLVSVLGMTDHGISWWAAAALERIGPPAVEALISALSDKRWESRQQAAEVLGRLGDRRAIEPLVATLGDWNGGVSARAAAALEKLGWVAPDDQRRVLYGKALTTWKELNALGRLTTELLSSEEDDHSHELPGPAVEVMGKFEDSQSVH